MTLVVGVGGSPGLQRIFASTSKSPAHDHAGNLVDDGRLIYKYDAWNRLVLVRSKEDAVTIHVAEFYGDGRRSFKTVTNAGQHDGTEVYYYDGQKIIAIYDGSANWVSEFIHGTQCVDEHIMVPGKGQGELYYHQGDQSERELPTTGKADMDVRERAAPCPAGVSTRRTNRGANWSVVAIT